MLETLEGVRILLLDDDLLTLELFEFVLTSKNAEVKKMSTAAKGLEVLESWSPDIIISDISMPGEDGFSFIQKMRENERTRLTPVIAVTGYGSPVDQERLRQSGSSEILIKPVNPDRLVSLICELLAKRQSD